MTQPHPQNADHAPPKQGEPPLHRAARTGDHESIRTLVRSGADVNAAFDIALDPGARPRPATPLMVAAGSGDGATLETVKLLLELGADPTITLASGSAARFACMGLGWNYAPGGDADRLEALLAAGSPLPLTGEPGSSLVADTALNGDPGRLRVLLARGAPASPIWDPEKARQQHEQAMQQVRKAGEQMVKDHDLPMSGDMLEDVFAQMNAPPSAPSLYEIPLHAAALSGNAECVRLLLGAGADVNLCDSSGESALMSAASADVVRVLAAAGADLQRVTQFNRDALDEALDRAWSDGEPDPKAIEVAAALLGVGVPLERVDEDGASRLYMAAFRENPLAVRFLLERGHPLTSPNGSTPLHALCWHWDHDDPERDKVFPEIIQMLLDAGLDVNAREAGGNTALHECVAGDGANAVAALYLLSKGADPNSQNNEGQSPLIYLYDTHFEYEKMVPLLLEHGANPLISDKAGKNAIDHARDRAAGREPQWRIDQFKGEDRPMEVEWKDKAAPGSPERRLIQGMEEAARKFHR